MQTISFVTTCKGRLHHIRQTLPTLVAESPDEIIVVDYGCPDDVGTWVAKNYPSVKVVAVSDDPEWCAARARNAGARSCTSDWICFIDADVRVSPGWIDWMRDNLNPHCYYRVDDAFNSRHANLWGTIICHRKAFEGTHGYDELFRGWGGEDTDLYRRLRLTGLREASYPSSFVESIDHDDSERLRFSENKDKIALQLIHRLYMEAKVQLMVIQSHKGDLPIESRTALMALIRKRMEPWLKGNTQEIPTIHLSADGTGWLPSPYRILKKFHITLTLETSN